MRTLTRAIVGGLTAGLMVSALLVALPSAPSTAASASLVEIGSSGTPSNGSGAFATANFGGWLQGFATGDMWSSPAVGDVTGDSVPEIVVGGVNSIARVYSISGQLLTTIDPGGTDAPGGVGATHASPALGDINGDGTDDIVLANTGSIMSAYSFKNKVLVNLMKKFEDRAFNAGPNGLFATPALGYVDGDNRLDIVTASWGQRLDVWSRRTADRVSNWPQWL
jgi:hypothetical protein